MRCRLLPLLALAACGPAIQQSPEKQAIADDLHREILAPQTQYRNETGVKVLAACIKWQGQRPVSYSSIKGYFYPTAVAAANRPIGDLERQALGDCVADVPPENRGCECQIADKNAQNAIVVP